MAAAKFSLAGLVWSQTY